MINLPDVAHDLEQSQLAAVAASLIENTHGVLANLKHGDLPRWQLALDTLPHLINPGIILDQATITIGNSESLPTTAQRKLRETLLEFIPWRKGPYSICGTYIDTEWRSDWKWERLEQHIQPLAGRRVLDVGCGSGYHMWRMKALGANYVLGIDPGVLFVMQFNVLQHFIQQDGIAVLPLKLEQMPADLGCFDTVFSMGVLYHRRDPMEHLADLRNALTPAGELVLETLVLPEGQVLTPADRYARMRNVWQIPSVSTLLLWLQEAGFSACRAVSDSRTTIYEQRSTDWMPFESLAETLDPTDPTLTIEGYPAPRRAIVIART